MIVETQNMITGEMEEEVILSTPFTEYNGYWMHARRLEEKGDTAELERMKANNTIAMNVSDVDA